MSESTVTATGAIKPATESVRHPATHQRARSRFYVAMAGGLLLIVLLGFTPTLYLRAFFDVPEIPVSVFVHGIVLTAWFVALFLQTALVAVGRTDIHRRLGWVVGGLGVGILTSSTAVNLNFVPRWVAALGVDIEARIAVLSAVVWTNFAALLAFTIFLSTAIALRRHPESHKRLMLLASISLVQPALSRIFRWPGFAGLENIVWSLVSQLLLVFALGLYDLVSRKRVHPVTLLGGSFFMGAMLVSMFLIATSEAGRSFVRGLG